MSYGAAADANLFKVPAGLNEVKELSPWNAAKIRKEMGGKPAAELNLTDMQGKPLTLSSLRGKTVLLDFWTTWCPPCRADAPNLDKLSRKYGPQSLMIVGISVSEERDTVEKFLKEHPHSFPIALTTENEMPRPYQISAFPTYIVIEKDGVVPKRKGLFLKYPAHPGHDLLILVDRGNRDVGRRKVIITEVTVVRPGNRVVECIAAG